MCCHWIEDRTASYPKLLITSGGCDLLRNASSDPACRVGKGVLLHAVPTRLRSFSKSACRVADAAAPVRRQHPTCDIAVEAAMRPIANLGHMPMLHGVEVNVVDMTLQV